MFKSRSAAAGAPPTTQASIEVIRLRARQRLIGAAVLVGVGVIGFPLVFDTSPRPMSADVTVEIPERQLRTPEPPAKPAVVLAEEPAPAPAPAAQPEPQRPVPARESLDSSEEIVPPAAKTVAAKSETSKPEESKAAPKSEPKAEPKPEPKTDATAKTAENLPTTNTRIVVQVGAFSDAAKAREARLKLERAGLTTYTQVANTSDGQRIRVRMGPFKTKAEADKAAARAKAMGLEAGLYWL